MLYRVREMEAVRSGAERMVQRARKGNRAEAAQHGLHRKLLEACESTQEESREMTLIEDGFERIDSV